MRLNGTLETDGDYLILNTEATKYEENATGGIRIKRYNEAGSREDAILQFNEDKERFEAGIGTSTGGRIFTIPLKYVHYQSVASNTWTVVHNLNTKNILAQVIITWTDGSDYFIYPDYIRIVDETTIEIKFSTAISGRVVIIG